MMQKRSIGSYVVLVALAACGFIACSSSSGIRDGDGSEYYVITESEIIAALEKRPMQNVFEVIEFLGPKMLRPRPQQSVSRGVVQAEPVVYMNGVRFGLTDELRNIPIQGISEIKYLKGNEATLRYGIGHEGGAILISTR